MPRDSKSPRIENIAVDLLKPYEKNARTHSPEQILQIEKSIQEFGFINPLIVSKDHMVLAGHGRLEAAKNLGLETVPVLVVSHFTPEQIKAYIIADNKIALNAGWDYELLFQELSDLEQLDFDVTLTGFSTDELEKMKQISFEDGYEKEGDAKDEEIDPADTQGVIGSYRFEISREDFKTWEEDIRASVGFKKSDIIAEIRRRLNL